MSSFKVYAIFQFDSLYEDHVSLGERSRRMMAGRWWTVLIWLCLQDTTALTLHVSLTAVIVSSALRDVVFRCRGKAEGGDCSRSFTLAR